MAWWTAEVWRLEGTERKQQKDHVTCAMKCKMINTSLYVEVKLQDGGWLRFVIYITLYSYQTVWAR
jgi:hypothetical protein